MNKINNVTFSDIKSIYLSPQDSHKGQNGRLLIIGGSHLFHAASLWALTTSSKIVDLVHYASTTENNEIVKNAKAEFRNGIVISRNDIEAYIKEDDCILIGPGMVRKEILNKKYEISNINELEQIEDEGGQTEALTNFLLKKYPEKQWVIDAGALQMMDIKLVPKNAILTPHHGEFNLLWSRAQAVFENFNSLVVSNTETSLSNPLELSNKDRKSGQNKISPDDVLKLSQKLSCIFLLKGPADIVCSPYDFRIIEGGNPGMTKGGTGDVLAGLVAALACKNDPFLATTAGSYINKIAGDELFKTVGPYFNASDLVNEIPFVMKKLFFS